jgi:hypothetical protein
MKVDTKEMSRQLVLFVAYPFSNTLERYLWKILEVPKSGRLVALSPCRFHPISALRSLQMSEALPGGGASDHELWL